MYIIYITTTMRCIQSTGYIMCVLRKRKKSAGVNSLLQSTVFLFLFLDSYFAPRIPSPSTNFHLID